MNIEIIENHRKSIFNEISFDPLDGSLYNAHSRKFFSDATMDDDGNLNKSRQTIYSFDSPNGSPYSRRYPSKNKENVDKR